MDRNLVWGGVAIVALVTCAVTFLAAVKADTSVILLVVSGVILPLLAALGYGEIKANRQATETVRQQTNGNTTEMLSMIKDALNKLAQAQPIDDDPKKK